MLVFRRVNLNRARNWKEKRDWIREVKSNRALIVDSTNCHRAMLGLGVVTALCYEEERNPCGS